MSSEQDLPEAPTHQGPPPAMSQDNQTDFQAAQTSSHGMGQSKSSRRRRRKRKNKGPELAGEGQGSSPETGTANGSSDGEVPSLTAAAAPALAQPAQPGFSQGHSFQAAQGHQNGASNGQGGTKRWKKKFRDRDRPRFTENPGSQAPRESHGGSNGSSGGGGSNGASRDAAPVNRDTNTHQFGNRTDSFKRKGGSSGGGGGKQQHRDRGPRSFVGPMDHSYRAVNGEFGETPPSTIPTQAFVRRGGASFHTGDSQPIDYSQGRPIPIAEDAKTRIYFFIEDLFFLAKISETARKLGVKVVFVKSSDKEAIAALTTAEEDDRPALIVFDLNNANAKPLTLIPKLKNKLKRGTSIIGFLSHIQGDLKAKAVEAGCDTVMARAAFSQNLPNLLRRYGLEEEEESNFNY